jgi:hypothetical protein
MKSAPKVILAVVVALAAIAILYRGLTPSPKPAAVDGARILAAARGYTQMLHAKRMTVPPTVSLGELVFHGLLRPEDVKAFEGVEVTVSLTADRADPRSVLLRAHLPDGQDMVALTDGSVRYEDREKK